ncbi:MAG: response regulator transcription factor [Bacteroidetes bacterium]|nr:response regulator transcription factor [Bacteroidota bacterium]MBS1934660.1 response regulator transcription factor [Bacteroidota bacterium]
MCPLKILVVEDEKKIAESISQGLTEKQFDVDIALDGLSAKKMIADISYDLIILDINVPFFNGYELCVFIRQQNKNLPVLMLTAMDTLDQKLAGFDAGTDDYLVKPFDFKELLVRVKALLKRSSHYNADDNVLQVSGLVMNLDSKQVTRNGKEILLTAKEFQLLEYFIRNKNRVLSRADIAIDVWDIDFDTGTNVIDVYVNFLRKKIDKEFDQKLIFTYVGLGYILKENG